jgi:5-(carboxyamino)imidazole ribonucleotide synthase
LDKMTDVALGLATRIGIVGGGQLGKMMALEAKKMGIYVVILDPDPNCCARSVTDEYIEAGLKDREGILELARRVDVVTWEIEHINVDALLYVQVGGTPVFPSPLSLKIIQNKLTQKQKLLQNGVRVPEFIGVEGIADILNAGEKFGYPMMLKVCMGGYDGRGNYLIRSIVDIQEAFLALGGGKNLLMVEKFVDFSMEISVLACRGRDGTVAIYPVAQNEHREEQLYETMAPADIYTDTRDSAMAVARRVMEVFDGVGMFCVEMFVTKNGKVLVNEIAPRPHNSGHYTIEGCTSSQFENHVRAVCGLPLGSTKLIRPTVMRNILGEFGHAGPAYLQGAEEALAVKGVWLHVYGKLETRPKRKMGHLTAMGETLMAARQKIEEAHSHLKMISRE